MNEASVRKYIREQENADQIIDKVSVKELEDPLRGSELQCENVMTALLGTAGHDVNGSFSLYGGNRDGQDDNGFELCFSRKATAFDLRGTCLAAKIISIKIEPGMF